jgi:hypothetical protein
MSKDIDIIIANAEYDGLNPLLLGCEKCRPSHAFGPAVRGYYLIHYIVSGAGIFRTKEKEYRLQERKLQRRQKTADFHETQADTGKPWQEPRPP